MIREDNVFEENIYTAISVKHVGRVGFSRNYGTFKMLYQRGPNVVDTLTPGFGHCDYSRHGYHMKSYELPTNFSSLYSAKSQDMAHFMLVMVITIRSGLELRDCSLAHHVFWQLSYLPVRIHHARLQWLFSQVM